MIQYLTEAEKQLSRDLWEEAFPEDSRQFDDYYYKKKVKENRILALAEEPGTAVSAAEISGTVSEAESGRISAPQQIAAMVQLNPYLVQAGSCRWQVDYLVGVATRKDKRHRGYMRSLLLQMMEDMRKAQMPFCFLMPAAEAIYRPFGFTYIFDQPRWRLQASAEGKLQRKRVAGKQRMSQESLDAASAASWMMGWLQYHYQVFAVRDAAYVELLLEELASEDGALEALYDGDRLAGFQAAWGWGKKEQRLLYAESSYIEEAAEPKPAIMARIITPEEFVKAVKLKSGKEAGNLAEGEMTEKAAELTVNLWLEDPLIPRNDGLWHWHLNRETSWMERKEEPVPGQPQLKLTITELTSWLFGYSVPETVGKLNEKLETLQGVFLDEVV